MRSRPLVRLLVSRSPLEPGGQFEADVILSSRSETPTEHVDVTLTGQATTAIPQGKTSATSNLALMQPQTYRWTPGTLVKGEHRHRIGFAIAPDVPPSYVPSRGWCRVSYHLEVRVVIPYWIDRRAVFALQVGAPTRSLRGSPSALVATEVAGPTANHIYIEAALDTTEIVPGDILRGEVSFANIKGKRIRRVNVAFVAYEQTRQPVRTVNVVVRHAATLVSGAPLEGESYPFRFALPKEMWPSIDARIFALKWQFEVRVDVILGADVVLTVPLDVMRVAPDEERPPRSQRGLPVGRQRLGRLWAIVAQRVGMTYDDGDASMLASRGPVSLKLAREAFEGTLGIVAHYRYPHLGLDVHLTEKGLFDAIAVLGKWSPRTKRFTIVGREDAQLAAFFDDAFIAHLETATEAQLDDDLAHVRVAGAASAPSTLETVARSALRLLELIEAAVGRIPPPAAMAAHVDAWRAFASELGGRFEPGRVWIHDATLQGFRFSIGTLWEPRDLEPIGTIVRAPIEPPLSRAPSVEDATLSATAREALRTLLAIEGFRANEEELALFLPTTTADPATLLPRLESMAFVLRSLRGIVAAGPFR